MKPTIVGLVTPHLLKIIDLAQQAQAGVNVDWHLRETVSGTLDELRQQYNARDLLAAYVDGLDTAMQAADPFRKAYATALQAAAATARRALADHDRA